MKLIAAHVFEARGIGRAAEESSEMLDPLHVVMLGLRRELADRHVFDHAPPQRAYGLTGHEGCSCLGEGCRPARSQDRTPRSAIVLAVSPAAAPYRASELPFTGMSGPGGRTDMPPRWLGLPFDPWQPRVLTRELIDLVEMQLSSELLELSSVKSKVVLAV